MSDDLKSQVSEAKEAFDRFKKHVINCNCGERFDANYDMLDDKYWDAIDKCLELLAREDVAVVPLKADQKIIEAGITGDPLACDLRDEDMSTVYSSIYAHQVRAGNLLTNAPQDKP